MVVDLPASASDTVEVYHGHCYHLSNIFENQTTWWENQFLSSYWILTYGILANDTQHPHPRNSTLCQVHWKCIWMVKCISMFGIQVPYFLNFRWSFERTDPSEDPGNQGDSTKVLGKIWIRTSKCADILFVQWIIFKHNFYNKILLYTRVKHPGNEKPWTPEGEVYDDEGAIK